MVIVGGVVTGPAWPDLWRFDLNIPSIVPSARSRNARVGVPPEGVTWAGEDENGRLVDNGQYDVRITVVDDLGQAWDYLTDVEIMGFADRTRVPIRVEVSGNSANGDDANSEVQGGSK